MYPVSWCVGKSGMMVAVTCWADSAVPQVHRARVRLTELLGIKHGTSGHMPCLRKSRHCQWGTAWNRSKIIKCYGFAICNFYLVKILRWCWQDSIQTNRSPFPLYFKISSFIYFLKRAAMFISCWTWLFFNSKQASSRKRNSLIPKAGT